MLFNREYKYILTCDLETNGLNPLDQWLTGSFGLLDFHTLKTIKELEVESKPDTFSEDAYEIHFINEQTAMNFQSRDKAIIEILNFIPHKEDFVFLCHANVNNFGSYYHFDYAVLKSDFDSVIGINFFEIMFKYVHSTHTIARNLQREGLLPKGLKKGLKDLCLYFGIDITNHHNAKFDRLLMEQLLRIFNELEPEQLSFI